MTRLHGKPSALTGLLAVVLLAPGFVILGGGPTVRSADEVVRFYTDHEPKVLIGSLLFGAGAVVFAFFIGTLSDVLRADGKQGSLEVSTLVGGGAAVTGMLLFAGVGAVLAGSAQLLDPSAVQAIHSLNSGTSPSPLPGGMAVVLAASGVSIISTRTLPRWLGWVAIALAAASVSPAGFAAFLASWVWIVAVSLQVARAGTSPPRSSDQ